ncbi:MAG TPA: type II toxin-antitoxin system HicA family toxin [Candidatus Paceibacterota bacterium]|nr:type II toxin-antitoxin system HicA family toxin [Candidatus Paceibacterota bacterium]HMO82601.1 type II toxin-antitoxin system HicA family toxin [Candidatus Paceibacterota bacterium]
MPKPLKPKALVKILEENGFILIRQRGSHALFKHADGRRTTMPLHNRELPVGTLLAIFKQVKINFN